jgi:hypothetical protein
MTTPPRNRSCSTAGLTALTDAGVVELEVSDRPVVVWSIGGLRSALDTNSITEGRTVGATGAFDPVLDGRRLHFRHGGADRFGDPDLAGADARPVRRCRSPPPPHWSAGSR